MPHFQTSQGMDEKEDMTYCGPSLILNRDMFAKEGGYDTLKTKSHSETRRVHMNSNVLQSKPQHE